VLTVSADPFVVEARLLALTGAAGPPRGSHDLIIAAHAAETGRLILTADAAARFADLPQVEVA
jgi:predicted nucleic acid-binding protein